MELRVVFRRTGSPQFAAALELARRESSFVDDAASKERHYSVCFSQDRLEQYQGLMAIVGRWAQTRVYLNRQAVDRERLDALVACYQRRLAAPDKRAYCAGCDVHQTRVGPARQLFPCRLIPISESNHRGWFQFGHLTRDRVFVIDKGRLRQVVGEHLKQTLAEHCPALFPAEVDGIIDRLPERIDPKADPQWVYKEGWQNGKFVSVGVEKVAVARAGAARPAVAKSLSEAGAVPSRQVPSVRFSDIGGLGPQVRLVRENLELPLRYPELFAHLGIQPHRGLLLAGPPGTGKTLIARALATESEAHFCVINGPEVISKWHGESEANLRRVFEEARELQPSVVLIDELDSIAPDRSRVTHNFEAVLVSQLLTLMDGLVDRGRVVVVGTTNRPGNVDAAVRRPGRLDLLLEIGRPDATGRLEILRIHTRPMPLAADVDLEAVADATDGFVGADLALLCREAGLECLRGVVSLSESGSFHLELPAIDGLRVEAAHFERALASIGRRFQA